MLAAVARPAEGNLRARIWVSCAFPPWRQEGGRGGRERAREAGGGRRENDILSGEGGAAAPRPPRPSPPGPARRRVPIGAGPGDARSCGWLFEAGGGGGGGGEAAAAAGAAATAPARRRRAGKRAARLNADGHGSPARLQRGRGSGKATRGSRGGGAAAATTAPPRAPKGAPPARAGLQPPLLLLLLLRSPLRGHLRLAAREASLCQTWIAAAGDWGLLFGGSDAGLPFAAESAEGSLRGEAAPAESPPGRTSGERPRPARESRRRALDSDRGGGEGSARARSLRIKPGTPPLGPAPRRSSSRPETLKKSKRSVRAAKGPACYESGRPGALPKKMAAELYPPSAPNTNLAHSNAAANSKKNALQLQHSAQPPPPPPLHNLNNNHLESANWQSCHPTLRERNALMFNNELMADVHFIVGPMGAAKKVPAHKYVLAVGSSVFYAMFYGDLAEVKSEIHIPDVEPAAFLILLKYMYSDEIDLEADTVLATLYAAKKYIVPALAKACVNFLETSLEAKNACVLLSQSRLFEEPELTQRCWEVIDAQAEMALKSEGFCEIDQQTLEIIVTREALNTKEVVVFEAVLNWAEAECRRQGLPVTPRNKRNVLGKALYLVRIPTMTLEEFANGAAQSDILTLEERHNIFLWYTAANKPTLEFPLTKRKGLVPQRCHRFQSSAYRSNQWRYRGRCDSIQFAVDKRIFIAGLGLYGSSSGKAEYSVKIELKRLGAVLAQNLTKFTSDGSSNTFSVWFEHPVQVEQDTFYNVSAILDGNELSYFGQEGMTEVQCGKVTFQFQCSSDSTNGTGVQGGQIPELIFYA